MSNYIGYGLRIAGFGNVGAAAADKRHLICTVPPGEDPDGLAIAALDELPDQLAGELSLREATLRGGEVKVFLAAARKGVIAPILDAFASWGRLASIGPLGADLDATSTTVALDVSGHDGAVVWLGLEAVQLGTYSSPNYTGCTRRVLGTVARSHRLGLPVTTGRPAAAEGLPCELVRFDVIDGGELVLMRGHILGRDWTQGDKGPRLQLTLQSALKTIERGAILREPFVARVVRGTWRDGLELSGAPGRAPIQGAGGDLRAMMQTSSGVVFEVTWSRSSADAEVVMRSTGRFLNTPDSFNPDGEIEEGFEAVETIIVGIDDPPPLRTTAGASVALPTAPTDLVRAILTTTGGGDNGAADLGVEGIGLGIDGALFDDTAWDRAASKWRAINVSRFPLSPDPTPGETTATIELIKRILPALGAGLVERDGLIEVYSREDVPRYGDARNIGLEAAFEPMGFDFNSAAHQARVNVVSSPIGRGPVSVDFKPDPSWGADLYPFSPVVRRDVEADALGPLDAQLAAAMWFEWSSNPPPIVTALLDTDAVDVKVCDVVTITNAHLPPRGVVGATAQAIRSVYTFGPPATEGVRSVNLALTSDGRRIGRVAPAGRIANVVALADLPDGTHRARLDIERHWYTLDPCEPLEVDTAGWQLGDRLQVVDEAFELVTGWSAVEAQVITRDVSGVDQIVVAFTPGGTPSGAYAVRLATEGNQPSATAEVWSWSATDADQDPDHWSAGGPPLLGEGGLGDGWRKTTRDAYDGDQPLDVATLGRAVASTAWCASTRIPAVTISPAPWATQRLFGSPDPMVLPVQIPCTGIERVRLRVPATVRDASLLVRPVRFDPVLAVWRDLAPFSTLTVGDHVDTFDLDVSEFGGLQRFGIEGRSTLAASGVLTLASSDIDGALDRYLDLVPNATARAPLAVDTVYRMDFVVSDDAPIQWRNIGPRLVLASNFITSLHEALFVWPRFSPQERTYISANAAASYLTVNLTPMGHAEIAAVSVEVLERTTATLDHAQLRHGLAPVASELRRVASVQRATLTGGRWWALGAAPGQYEADAAPGVLDAANSPDTPRLPWGTLTPAEPAPAAEGGLERVLWASVVGAYESLDTAAGVRRLRTIRVAVEVSAVHQGGGPQSQTARLRLRVSDDFDDDNAAEGDVVAVELPVITPATEDVADAIADRASLATFSRHLDDRYTDTWGPHVARGLVPLGGSWGARVVELVVTDTVVSTRRTLSVILEPPLDDDLPKGGAVRVLCWGAWARAGEVPT